MKLVSMKNMLEKAKQENRAIGAFNILNLEWTQAILKAAAKSNQDVIISVSENAAKYMGGFKTIANMVGNLVEYYDCPFEVALHLDHGDRFEICKEAIDAGFTSVMIDASKLPIEENIAVTKQVVEYAHARGVSVEAEVGIVGGSEDDVHGDIQYASLEDCIRITNETGIDFLAPALGSVHGFYKGEPKLGFVEMKEIATTINLPLVLHGGSGIDDEKIQKAISCGICKINVNTENQVTFKNKLKEIVATDALDPRKLLGPAYDAMAETVLTKIQLFNN